MKNSHCLLNVFSEVVTHKHFVYYIFITCAIYSHYYIINDNVPTNGKNVAINASYMI